MAKYLYGANVKAVQSFIFQTNKLKEIIGASELVEQICTTLFESKVGNFNKENRIIAAAGIVKYVFDKKVECQNLVKIFPMVVFNTSPGIVFNQAVVKMAGEKATNEELKELEQRLKTQRNKAVPPLETGLRITVRSNRTGLPAIPHNEKESEKLDKATVLKLEAKIDGLGSLSTKLKEDNIYYKFPEDIKELTSKENFIAIIHADGNNLGRAIRDLNENTDVDQEVKNGDDHAAERNQLFSMAIDEATKAAAKTAIAETFKDIIANPVELDGVTTAILPMRPVILGGDDFTVICNAEYALKLTSVFLKEFEIESAASFKAKCLNLPELSACAGIAYIKTNYPFHYGVALAEELCKHAKKHAKEKNPDKVPACLAFHRVQSSFVGSYKEIIKRELIAPKAGLSFSAGPYFISNNNQSSLKDYQPTVDGLWDQVKYLRDKKTPVSKIREWISSCYISRPFAFQELDRIVKVLKSQGSGSIIANLHLDKLHQKLKEENASNKLVTTLYDAITIHSLNSKN